MSVNPDARPKDACRSWPHCARKADAPGGRFCLKHQQALDRCQAVLNPRLYRALGKPEVELAPAPMKVTWVEPTARPRRKRGEAKPKVDWPALIVAALRDGALTSAQLAAACSTNSQDRTFGRQRLALLESGGIVVVEGKPGRGSGSVFSLTPTAPPARATADRFDRMRELILAKLAAGRLNTAELAAAIGRRPDEPTLTRSRRELLQAGTILMQREGHKVYYALPSAAARAAA